MKTLFIGLMLSSSPTVFASTVNANYAAEVFSNKYSSILVIKNIGTQTIRCSGDVAGGGWLFPVDTTVIEAQESEVVFTLSPASELLVRTMKCENI